MQQVNSLMDEGVYGVEAMEKKLFMSVQTFRRRIKAVTGKSPLAFLTSARMNKAAKLLCGQKSMSVVSVALACGFSDCSCFVHAFKRFYGMTPSQYREQNKFFQ